MLRKGAYLLAGSGVGTTGYLLTRTEEERRRINQLKQASFRIANLVSTVGYIATDYGIAMSMRHEDKREREYDVCRKLLKELQEKEESLTFDQWNAKNKDDLIQAQNKFADNKQLISELSERLASLRSNKDGEEPSYWSNIHTRSAIRLRDMCVENKGVYIKLGQHLAMLDYLIPHEYQEVLTTLLSQNPTTPWEYVRSVIKEDLGAYPEDLFLSIDPIPIASASLAQVHTAYGKNGQKYAVKVQHIDLLSGSDGDRYAITYIVDLLSKVFKQFDYNWLTKEMNRNLPEELDFLNEARNIKQCTHNFKNEIIHGTVAVPIVQDSLTSTRVLTMSFEEGSYVTDLAAIESMRLRKKDIAKAISKVFCQQM